MNDKATALVIMLAVAWPLVSVAEVAATPEAAAPSGCALSGITVDERGAPVAGAKIEAVRDRGGRRVYVLYPNSREVIATTTSNAQGRFQLADLPAAKAGLEISADGFLQQSVPVMDLADCTTRREVGKIVLSAGAEISGRVTDRQGSPLAGVYVGGGAMEPESGKRWAKTSSDGLFSLRGLPLEGSIALRASDDGYFMAQPITVKPPFPTQVTLVLDRVSDLPRVVGRTLDPDRQPVAGATIDIHGGRVRLNADGSTATESSTSQSDAEGRFVVQGVTEDSFTARASAEGFQNAEVEIESHQPGSELVLTLHPAARIEGTVRDAQGRPVAGASLSLVAKAPGAPSGYTVSKDDGRYRLAGLSPGSQSIELKRYSNGHRVAVRDVVLEAGKNLLDFKLEPGSAVAGVVRDEQGRPVVGAVVDLHPKGTGGGKPALTDTTGDAGDFIVPEVPGGPYSIEIRQEGFPWTRLEDGVRVPRAGGEVPALEIVLPHGGSIAGAVRGLTPAEASLLSVTAIDQAHSVYQIRAHLEADGSYRIPGLRPGAWWVKAEVGRRSMTGTAVVRSGDATRLDLDFAGGLRLTGQLLRNAEPAAELPIALENLETEAIFSTATAADGRFQLSGLDPGSYRLGYRLGYRPRTLRPLLELDENLDLRFDLESLETRVSGRVVDVSSGRPLAGAELSLVPLESDHGRAGGSSDERGDFLLSGTLTGSYHLRAGKDGYSPGSTHVELRAGEPLAGLELELAPTRRLPLEVRWTAGVAPAFVDTLSFDAAGRRGGQEWHRLGQDGRFEVRQAPGPGGWLLVRAEGAATVRLPIPAGEMSPLWLEPQARLEISTPATSGPRRRVTLKDDRGEDYFLGHTGELSFRAHAPIKIDGLPAGTWTVVVESSGGPVWSESVTTWHGQTTALDLK